MIDLSRSCVVLLAALWGSGAVAESLTNAGLPDVRAGDVAVYETTNLRTGEKGAAKTVHVEQVTDGFIVTRTGSTIRKYTREWNLVEVAPEGKIDDTADPHLPQFRFPLAVGRHWSTLVTARSTRSAITNTHEWRGAVVSREQITVPAGTYDTFRLQAESSYTGQWRSHVWTGQRRVTYWYAPAIGRLVREDFEDTSPYYRFHQKLELSSFRRKGEQE